MLEHVFLLTPYVRMDLFNRISLAEPNVSFATAELMDNSQTKLKWEIARGDRWDNIPANNVITNITNIRANNIMTIFILQYLFNPKIYCVLW